MDRYESYKDSGIDWLGEVPRDWEVEKLFHHFYAVKGRNAAQLNKDYCSLHEGKYPVYSGQTENNGIMASISSYEFNYEKVLFSTTVGAKAMTVKLITGKFNLSQNCMIIIARAQSKVVEDYYYYLFNTAFSYYRNLIPDHMQASFRIDDLYQYPIALPPIHEQEVIAQFLDIKCAKIDDLIAIKTQQIDKLKELRQVKIHQAVTKGLDTSVEFKDSGIDWIGEIPKHWEVKRLKYVFQILKRIAGKLGLDVLSITQRGIKIKDITSGEGQLAMDYSKYQYAYKGDFAMNHMDLLTGWVDISNYDGVISPDYRVFELIDKNNISNYFLHLLQDCYRNKTFYAHGQGVSMLGRWRFPTENFNNFFFPIPPLCEQEAIVSYLEQETTKIEQAIAQRQEQIERLKAYKQSLINEVVTGKVKVA